MPAGIIVLRSVLSLQVRRTARTSKSKDVGDLPVSGGAATVRLFTASVKELHFLKLVFREFVKAMKF